MEVGDVDASIDLIADCIEELLVDVDDLSDPESFEGVAKNTLTGVYFDSVAHDLYEVFFFVELVKGTRKE